MSESWTLDQARLRAAWKMPYFGEILFSLRFVEKPGLLEKSGGCVAVDQFWNCYYDPDNLTKSMTMDECAFQLAADAWRCWVDHAKRGKKWYGDMEDLAESFAAASAFSVNTGVKEAGLAPPGGKGKDGKHASTLFPEEHGFKPNLTAEEYADLVLQSNFVEKRQDQRGGKQQGGSCGDGSQKEWESEGEIQGLEQAIREVISQGVAEQICKHQGTLPGSLKSQANAMLAPPVVRWQDELKAQIRMAVDQVRGHKDHTWMKTRKRGLIGKRVLVPGPISPQPRIALAIDTSGSMGSPDTQGRVLGEVNHVIKAYGKHIRVFAGDTCIQSEKVVSNASQVEWVGNGGTSMKTIVEQIVKRKPHYDIIILLTDGYTDWPDRMRAKFIAVITPDGHESAPPWAVQIKMKNVPGTRR